MNRRQFLATSAAGTSLMLLPSWIRAQGPDDRLPPGFDQPDDRGEVWAQVEYQGTQAYCAIPESLRQRNTGGSDGAGLCVIASQVTDGRFQQLQEEVAKLWATALKRPGGYWPERLKKLMAEVAPDVPYKSYEGGETGWCEAILRQLIPIGVTYGTGRGYRYQKIAHMVSLIHLDGQRVGVIDNNFPRWVAWMPRAEFDRRFVLGPGYGWAFYLDVPGKPKPKPGPIPLPVSPDGLGVPLALGGGVLIGGAVATAGFVAADFVRSQLQTNGEDHG